LYDTALEVHLNIGILKMIMGKPLGLEDLKDVDQVMATQLEWVLDNDVQGTQIWTRVYINHAHTTILFLSHSLSHTYTQTHTHTNTHADLDLTFSHCLEYNGSFHEVDLKPNGASLAVTEQVMCLYILLIQFPRSGLCD